MNPDRRFVGEAGPELVVPADPGVVIPLREHAPDHPYGVQPGPNGMYARRCKRDDCDWHDVVKPGGAA